MGFLDLFVVALMPVLELLLVTGVGLLLAIDRIDLLGPSTRHHLNNLVFYVFGPLFIVTHLGETITFRGLVTIWFMPLNMLLIFVIGSILAWILIKITRTPPHLQGLVIGCCSAGNFGNLLLIIVPAVCKESNNLFGDSKICSTYGTTYASLSMAVGVIYIWTYVYNVMRIYADTSNEVIDKTESVKDSESCTEAVLPSSDNPISNGHSVQAETPRNISERTCRCIKKFTAKINLKMVLNPGTIAAICGFIIGIISPFRRILIGDHAPLRVLDNSASLLGQATIPCMSLIVGANLLKGLKGSGVSITVIAGIIAVRNIFLPLIGIGVVKAARHLGMVGSDSLFQFILLLQYPLPPAMALGVMAQLFKAGESECSVIMMWTYGVATFSLTLWSTFYLWLLQ